MPQKRLSPSKSHLFRLILLLVIALLIIIGLVWFFLLRDKDPTKGYHPKYTVSSSEDQSKTSGGSSQTTESGNKNSDSGSPATDVTSEQVPIASSGSIIIDDLEQKAGYINAKATVSGFTTTQCVYSFAAEDAKPVVRQIDGTCQGISIPQGEFELIGTYTLTVTAYNGTSQKISVTKDINVQ
jgi:cytoskeletal protein RodZ